MKDPGKRGKNTKFFIFLGPDGKDVFLGGLHSASAAHIRENERHPLPPQERESAQASNNSPAPTNHSALKRLFCLKR